MNPRFGYLCLFENPTAEAGRALTRQAILAREAERMRYDDIWVAEHHFDPIWPCGAVSALLGYLAGVTTRARIGAAPLVPGIRDPIQLAEDIATLDLLTKGRFNLGIASGAAFPELAHFGLAQADAAARELETLELVHRLLREPEVTFAGAHRQVEKVSLAPRPDQPVPTWIATTTESTIRYAARQGYGLMAGATATAEQLRRMLGIYRDEVPDGNPRLVLARFGFTAPESASALEVAKPYLADFCTRMQTRRAAAGMSAAAPGLDPEALLSMSLIGSYDEVAQQVNQLNQEFGVHGLAIIPTTAQFDTVKRCLAEFVDEIRLRLPVD